MDCILMSTYSNCSEKELRLLTENLKCAQNLICKAHSILTQYTQEDLNDEEIRKDLDVHLKNLEKSIPDGMIPELKKDVKKAITRARMSPNIDLSINQFDAMFHYSEERIKDLDLILAQKILVNDFTAMTGSAETAKNIVDDIMTEYLKNDDKQIELV